MSSEAAASAALPEEVERRLLEMDISETQAAAVLSCVAGCSDVDEAVMRCLDRLTTTTVALEANEEELTRREIARIETEDAQSRAAAAAADHDEAYARQLYEQERTAAQQAQHAADSDMALAHELDDREQANEYIRAQSRPRSDNAHILRGRLYQFYENDGRRELHLSHLTDEEEVVVRRICEERGLKCKPQNNGETLHITKPKRLTVQPAPPVAVVPPPTPLPPAVDYNNHSSYNANGQRVMQPVRLTVQPAPPVAVAPPPTQAVKARRRPVPTSAEQRPPPPYEDVPAEVWLLMYELPFRVKYEVEVLVTLNKLVRWTLLPTRFVSALLDCVNVGGGEAVCVAALHVMRTLPLNEAKAAFQEACQRVASAGPTAALMTSRPPAATGASVAEQRSVEVLSCHLCCPGGKIIVRPAEFQSSNRVLRLVGDFCGTDALLRVAFVNDGTLTAVNQGHRNRPPAFGQERIARFWRERRMRKRAGASPGTAHVVPSEDEGPSKWTTVERAMRDGIRVGGELFRWLAPSASQMKSMGMWFVREKDAINAISATSLRRHLLPPTQRNFKEMKTAAIYLARLGQTLSATTVAVALQSEELIERIEVPDVLSESGEVISDGCCYASHKLLQLLHDAMVLQQTGERPSVARLLSMEPGTHLPSSAVQVRLGGIKGMLSQKMNLEGRQLCWRKSMEKFDADIVELEICEWATWHPGYLNRHIIMLLEHRNVPYEVFQRLQEAHLASLSACLTDVPTARQLLQSIGGSGPEDDNSEHAHAVIAGGSHGVLGAALAMLNHGVKPSDDAFLHSILQSVGVSLKRGVVEKARILLDEAAALQGIMDEEGVLEYGEIFVQVRPPWAPEDAGAQILQRQVVVYRPPGMHPAGVLLLTAVYHPELAANHVNRIVFPSRGPRPHAAEMSMGDLDGDKYLIIWEESIVQAVSQMAPELRPAMDKVHKKPTYSTRPQAGGSAAAASDPPQRPFVLQMPRPPAPVPPEHTLAARVAEEERLRQQGPHTPTIGDHLGHARARRRPMTAEEMQSEGEVLEATREARTEEELRRFESELDQMTRGHQREWCAATLRHERRQELAAMRFYIYFGRRHNVGQISNMWLAYADKYGCMHEDTLALCRLAQLAVQFVKTGVPVAIDRKRFNLAGRPDYMQHTKPGGAASGYKSTKALGRLFREAIAKPQRPAVAVDEAGGGGGGGDGTTMGGGSSSGHLASRLHVDGYERFLPEAIAARDAYESEVRWLLHTFGVESEGELLSGRVERFRHELVQHMNQRDNEETMRRSVHQLWTETRRFFDAAVARAVVAAGVPAARQLACAWYMAGYRLVHEPSPSSPPPADARPLHSFAWVAWPELIKVLRQNAAQQETMWAADPLRNPDLHLGAEDY